MDVMESPIERPKKHQKRFYSGKQKEHTLKTQLIIEQKTLKIISLKHGKGKTHDFRLFKNSGIKFRELLICRETFHASRTRSASKTRVRSNLSLQLKNFLRDSETKTELKTEPL